MSSQCVQNDYSDFILCNSSLFSSISISVYNHYLRTCRWAQECWEANISIHLDSQVCKITSWAGDRCLRQRSPVSRRIVVTNSIGYLQVLPLTFVNRRVRSGAFNFLKRLEFIKPIQGKPKHSNYILCINVAKGKAHLLMLQVTDAWRRKPSVTHGMLLSSLFKEGFSGRKMMIFRPRRRKRKRGRRKSRKGKRRRRRESNLSKKNICVCVMYICI